MDKYNGRVFEVAHGPTQEAQVTQSHHIKLTAILKQLRAAQEPEPEPFSRLRALS